MMKIMLCVLLVVSYSVCVLSEACATTSDCPRGEVCVTTNQGNQCVKLARRAQPCTPSLLPPRDVPLYVGFPPCFPGRNLQCLFRNGRNVCVKE